MLTKRKPAIRTGANIPIYLTSVHIRRILRGDIVALLRVVPDDADPTNPPVKKGDCLIVLEDFSAWFSDGSWPTHWNDTPAAARTPENCIQICYRATHAYSNDDQAWVNGHYMPRWASRLAMFVEDVKTTRLYELTDTQLLSARISRNAVSRLQRMRKCWNPWLWYVPFDLLYLRMS